MLCEEIGWDIQFFRRKDSGAVKKYLEKGEGNRSKAQNPLV